MFRQTSKLLPFCCTTKSNFLNQTKFCQIIRPIVSSNESSKKFVFTGNVNIDDKLDRLVQKIYQLMSIYEELIGLKELKEAQQSVIEAEDCFTKAQDSRRLISGELLNIQIKLKELRDQMDRLNRTDSSFLKLFTQEHEFLNQEKIAQNNYKLKESEERDLFFRFSALLRESQEKERARAERIKYLQLFLSVSCTFLGLLSAFLISFLRRTEIKEILNYEKESFSSISIKLDSFDRDQRELNSDFKKYLTSNNLNEILSKQNKILVDNFNGLQNYLTELRNRNDREVKISDHSSDRLIINDLEINRKLNKQQDLLKIISITSVLSTFFVCVLYFKGN